MAFDFTGLNKVSSSLYFPRILGRSRTEESDFGNRAAEREAFSEEGRRLRLEEMAQQEAAYEPIRLQKERAELEKRKAEKEAYEKWQTDNLLKTAYDKIYGKDLVKQGVAGERAIGEKTKQVGIELLKTNPSAGMKLIEQGNEQLKKSADAEQEVLQTEVARKEYAAKILTNVNDEEGWEYAKASLAKMGYPIPQQLMQYNDNTKKWIASQVVGSKSGLEAEKLDLRRDALKSQQEAFAAKQELAERKENRISTNQARSREASEIKYRTGTPAAQKEVQTIVSEMSAENEKFADLEGGYKRMAAQDLDPIARGIMLEGGKTYDQARAEARKIIYSRINEEGEYVSQTPFSGASVPSAKEKTINGVTYVHDGKGWKVKK